MGLPRRLVLGVAAVAVVAASVGLGWWAGSTYSATGGNAPSGASAVRSPSDVRGDVAASVPNGKGEGGPADGGPMRPLQCQARQFNGTLALAVTFSQPATRDTNLAQWISVSDRGRLDKDADAASDNAPVAEAKAGPLASNGGDAVAGSWVIGDDARVAYFPYVASQRRYALTFEAGLAVANSSEAQAEVAHCIVDTQVMPAAFYFASRGVVLPAGQNGGLPVATVNVPEVDVQFLRVDPSKTPEFFDTVLGVGTRTNTTDEAGDEDDYEDEASDWRYAGNRALQGLVGMWDLDRLRRLTTSVYQGRFTTDQTENERRVTFLPVEDIEALKAPGLYVAVMTQPGRFQYESQTTYFYVSDIGLHVRRYPEAFEAFSVSLTTGKPLADTRVELVDGLGKVLAQGKSDAAGHVRIEGNYSAARLIRSARGNEMTALALGEPALDLSEFDIGGFPATNNKLFVYAGRNLYRPGETFAVSVLARNPDGKAGVGAPLTATLKQADGKTVRTMLWQPQSDVPGYSEQKLDLPADAQTGAWRIELRVDPAQRAPDAVWPFQVEEFLPERMKLTLNAPDVLPSGTGDFAIDVQGDYLYGAPASGNRLLSSLQIKRQRVALPVQWPGFIFGDVADDDKKSFRQLDETTLSDTGAATIDIDANLDDVHSPMALSVSASLLESGGRPIVRSIERTLWPADTLIAIRPAFDRDVTREGGLAAFEVIRTDRAGKFVPIDSAQFRLFKENRQYYWRFDDQRGWNSGYDESETLLESRDLTLRERASVSVPVKWGRYRVEIEDPQTGEILKYRFYAGWDAQDAETLGNRPDRVQMQLSGTPAAPGGEVNLTLTPPHDGQALITIEGGDGLLWSKWVDAQAKGTTVTLPLDAKWRRHDLYVSAVVFRPGSQGDRVTPARAVGLAYLPMASEGRKLQVSIEAPAKTLPEQTVAARVKVAGAEGQSVYVTLSAVDVGILNINQYKTPDPFDFFFGKHRYGPELLDMYGKLIEKMEGKRGRLRWGGDSDMRGDSRSLPKKVKLVDLFSGVVKVDAQGYADIPLAVPDFNGTLRLMAVAFDDHRYGNGERDMQVAAPIVAELSTPRFITPGDQAAIALDLTNMSGAARTVTINVQADAPLRIADGKRSVTLADKERTILRFVATGSGGYGSGLIRMSIDAPEVAASGAQKPVQAYRAVRESILQVQAAYAPTRRVNQVRIAAGAGYSVPAEWVAGLMPDTTTVSLAVSTNLPFDVPRLVRDLLTYPYGCSEQTISSAMPWLLVDDDAAKVYKLRGDLAGQRQGRVESALSRLAGMRNSAGAYSLWGGSGERDTWLTAYGLSFLQNARAKGFTVPDRDLETSRQWLLTQLQRTHNNFGSWSPALLQEMKSGRVSTSSGAVLREDHRRFAGLAATSWVLARDKKAPLSTLRTLFDNYSTRSRSPLPLVHLAVAFKLMGDEKRAEQAVNLALKRDYGLPNADGRASEWLGDYGSAVRDFAQSYALLTAHDLAPNDRERFLVALGQRMSGRTYFSTQEQMALLQAAQAVGVAGKPWQIEWSAGGTPRPLAGTQSETIALPGSSLGQVAIRNTGDTPVSLAFDVQGTTVKPPVPDRSVVEVTRTWFNTDGTPWDGGALRTGDMLVVKLSALSRVALPDALIVDRIPAGIEVENLNLSQGPDMAEWTIGGTNVAQAMQDGRVLHTEFRDDRFVAAVNLGSGTVNVFYLARVVSPGRYTVPASTVEAMYRPDLRGVGASWRDIDIVDREVARP